MTVVALRIRHRLLVNLALLLLATMCVLEGLPYLFWNTYHPKPPGDIAFALSLLQMPWLRSTLLCAGGVANVFAIFLFSRLLYQTMARRVIGGQSKVDRSRHLGPLVLLALGETTWFLFDWDQLTPGLGQTPNVTSAAIQLLCVIYLGFRPPPVSGPSPPLAATTRPIILAWTSAAVALLIILTKSRTGLQWA